MLPATTYGVWSVVEDEDDKLKKNVLGIAWNVLISKVK